jgi:KDO2-lipid IV(A) lauroyltransferase
VTGLYHHPKFVYWARDPFWGMVDHLTYYGLRGLPARSVSSLGRTLGALAGRWRFPELSARVDRSLQRIRPDLGELARKEILGNMWAHLGRTLAEMSVLDRLWERADITIVNEKFLREQACAGRPVIFALAHFGNWEMLGPAIQGAGFKLNVVYEHLRNRFQRRLAAQSRRRIGYRLIAPNRAGVREMLAVLERREALCLAMDEFKSGDVIAPAFGRPLPDRANLRYIEKLAQRFDARVIPMYCIRTSPLAFRLTFVELARKPDAPALNALCESWIRAHPEQWYMLHRLKFLAQ